MKPIQIVAGVAAGLVGAILWASVAYFAQLEIGYIAWAIGLAVGIAIASTGENGLTPGIAAVSITVVSLLVGKSAAVVCEFQGLEDTQALVQQVNITDDNLQDYLAAQIVGQRQAAGQTLQLPKLDGGVSFGRKYPVEIWKEAREQLKEMPNEQKQSLRAEQKATLVAEIASAHEDQLEKNGFFNSFTIFDLVFFGLAIATAWGVATRQEVDLS